MKKLCCSMTMAVGLIFSVQAYAISLPSFKPGQLLPPIKADCTKVQQQLGVCRIPAQGGSTQFNSDKVEIVPSFKPGAPAEFVPCEGVARISINIRRDMNNAAQIVKARIDSAISNITADINHDGIEDYFINGKYQLCFDMPSTQLLGSGIVFSLHDQQLAHDVVISGLNLQKAPGFQGNYLLDISSQQKVTLIDSTFSAVSNGIHLSGADHELKNVTVSGDNTGDCVVAEPEGVIIRSSHIDHCRIGLHVRANNVLLSENSYIMQNQIGVYVDVGMMGFDIQDSFVFGNNDLNPNTPASADGIRFADPLRIDPFHYYSANISRNSYSLIEILNEHLDFVSEQVPYFSFERQEPVQVSIYISNTSDCGFPAIRQVAGQPCGKALADPIEISQEQLQIGNPIQQIIPDLYRDKNLVLMLRDSRGINPISREVNLGGGSIVALGGAPEPIVLPTQTASAGGAGSVEAMSAGSGENSGEGLPASTPTGSEEVTVVASNDNTDVGGGYSEPSEFGVTEEKINEGSSDDSADSDKESSSTQHATILVAADGAGPAAQMPGSEIASGVDLFGGASSNCSLNKTNQFQSPMSVFMFITVLLLVNTRRKMMH